MFALDSDNSNSEEEECQRILQQFENLDSCLNSSGEKELCAISDLVRGQPKKKVKSTHQRPTAFIRFNTRLGKPKPVTLKVPLDSGASDSVICEKYTTKPRKKTASGTVWTTPGGKLITNQKVKSQFTIPELHDDKLIEWEWHVAPTLGNYDAIIGRDLMEFLKIDVLFSDQTIRWENAVMPFKDGDASVTEAYYVQDPEQVEQASDRLKKILDAKYEAADLKTIAESQTELSKEEQQQLCELLDKYASLFDGTLGRWTGTEAELDLVEGATPHHARAFPLPKIHLNTLKIEVERLCKLGVLKKVNRSQWAAPTFVIPKKDGSVRFISDFRELNKRIKRRPYPLPHIQDLLMNLEGFKCATSLDLKVIHYLSD